MIFESSSLSGRVPDNQSWNQPIFDGWSSIFSIRFLQLANPREDEVNVQRCTQAC